MDVEVVVVRDVDVVLEVLVELVLLVVLDVLDEVEVVLEVDVLVLVVVVDVGGRPWLSSAPMSQTAVPLALPSTFRGNPAPR